jgi:hypothetical protein
MTFTIPTAVATLALSFACFAALPAQANETQPEPSRAAKDVVEPFPVSLKVRNTSLFPVRADIPGLMQANFLPFSTSYAGVPVGQEIYFDFEGKRTLLLRIESAERNQEIIINEVVAKRRAELKRLAAQ